MQKCEIFLFASLLNNKLKNVFRYLEFLHFLSKVELFKIKIKEFGKYGKGFFIIKNHPYWKFTF